MSIIENTKEFIEKCKEPDKKTGFNASAVEDLLKKYLEGLRKVYSADQAMAVYNMLLCHIDLFTDKVSFKSLHKRVALDACSKARENSVQEYTFAELAQKHVVIKPNMSRICGINKVISCSSNYGIVTPYFTVDELPEAIISGCTHVAIGQKADLDAGVFINLQTASEKEFNEAVNILIDSCNSVYGVEITRNLLVDIVESALRECSQDEIINLINGSKGAPELLATLKQAPVARKEATIDFVVDNYRFDTLFPVAEQLSQTWIKVINESYIPIIKDFRIGLGSVKHLLITNPNKHVLVSSLTKSFLCAINTKTQEQVQAVAGQFAVPYRWLCHFTNKKGTESNFSFTLDEVMKVSETPFCIEGDHKIEVYVEHFGNKPTQAVFYQLEDGGKDEPLPDNDEIFAVILQSGLNSIPTWGKVLSHSQANAALSYLDFLPGQEQDSIQDIIMCKMTNKPNNIIANAIKSHKTAFVIVKVKNLRNETA